MSQGNGVRVYELHSDGVVVLPSSGFAWKDVVVTLGGRSGGAKLVEEPAAAANAGIYGTPVFGVSGGF